MTNKPESIVRYWQAVEMLQPQSAPKKTKRNKLNESFFDDTFVKSPDLPWAPRSKISREKLPKNREWSHTLYAHLYDSRLVADALEKQFGTVQAYREPQYRESALFATKFNMEGELVGTSFVLSSEAWFLGRALAGLDWTRGFDKDQQIAANRAEIHLGDQVSGEALRDFIDWVLQFLGVADIIPVNYGSILRFRSQPVKPDMPASEDNPLNSFLLDDLANVADSIRQQETSEALHQYLRRHDPKLRLHIDTDIASQPLIERLMPQAYADGCWPSKRHMGLVHSQQLAVNTVLSTLADGQGLLGVNGPPGTGKTTLLRDLIAAIITSRADVLSTLRCASDGFAKNSSEACNYGGKEQVAYKLNPALYGFEIAVASSNNGAAENVTLELPQRDTIDESWLPESEHFADLGELITGKPAWGMISGALGSKARRTQFVKRYFFGDVPERAESNGDVSDDAVNVSQSAFAIQTAATKANGEQALSEKQKKKIEGLMAWLGRHNDLNKERTSEQRKAQWKQAVAKYLAAKAQVRTVCAEASRIRTLIQALLKARERIDEATSTLQTLELNLANMAEQQARMDAEQGGPANAAFKYAIEALIHHQASRPGFWANLLSLWGASRAWRYSMQLLQGQHDFAKAEAERLARLARQTEASCQKMEHQIAVARKSLQQVYAEEEDLTRQASDLARACRAAHVLEWLNSGIIGRGDAIELAEPWHIDGWRHARARVFIQALKLHKMFIELEAARMRSNLFLINALLLDQRVTVHSRDAIRSAWASLFMVVPVLSSTFASFARTFRSLDKEEIGWLLVDEAGQATPQAAVGALWRSRRALLVGDPLQLKPVVTVSDTLLEHMRTRYCIDPYWLPNRQSAQTLADQATTWGRKVGSADSKTWVGLPLVVHRRCDRPMHDLANRIAYGGAMVYGTAAPSIDQETHARLPTGWIHVTGKSNGNWVPAEGKALLSLLSSLRNDGVNEADISVITPFKAVQEKLKLMLKHPMVYGTIHTMQGKEATVVIMVLGGNTETPGARDWAVSEPNLLNVAATRAKRRFYVIGDRNDWKNRTSFRDVMDLLPLQNL